MTSTAKPKQPRKTTEPAALAAAYGSDPRTLDSEELTSSLYAAAARKFATLSRLFDGGKARVSVGRVALPLHLTEDQLASGSKKVAHTQMLHHMAMQEMAGTNWQGQPKGFRIAPTSRKNLATHRKSMLTRVEGLAKAAWV